MDTDKQLEIAPRQGSDRTILELQGELDIVSAPLLQKAVENSPRSCSALVLDLRAVSFLDSTGLKAIFAVRKMVQERGQTFAVTQGSPQVERLLGLTGLGDHLTTIVSPEARIA